MGDAGCEPIARCTYCGLGESSGCNPEGRRRERMGTHPDITPNHCTGFQSTARSGHRDLDGGMIYAHVAAGSRVPSRMRARE